MKREIDETREKFHLLAKQSFPNVGEPETVWVLSEVLGWDFEKIQTVAIDGFSKESYRVFVLDEDGNRTVVQDRADGYKYPMKVTRAWTKEEKAKLKDWWWLLGF